MIIGRDDRLVVAQVVAGLQHAAAGVLQVLSMTEEGSASSHACGWLLTPSLVVLPDFAAAAPGDEAQTFRCRGDDSDLAAELAVPGSDAAVGTTPAVLRLERPLEGRALRLGQRDGRAGDHVFVVQYGADGTTLYFSSGWLHASGGPQLRYDASTDIGSAGAPVLGADWTVVGMHVGRDPDQQPFNVGISLTAILDALRRTAVWDEVAHHHQLIDATTDPPPQRRGLEAPSVATDDLLPAAVSWTFDPSLLSDQAAATLRPLVVDADAERWLLPARERVVLLRAAGSLDRLRAARRQGNDGHPGQPVIDRILAGPPFDLDAVEEATLPYWLQATRWFADVIPSLPTPGEVNRELERRRVRSRLAAIGGSFFRGRKRELETLARWYADPTAGPMVVTGIGGVGKSALVAHFALSLPEDVPLLWLDFDRPDIAPDDPVSVVRPLVQQLAVQLDDFEAPEVDDDSWEDVVDELGPRLARAPPALLVLDGFEVAQHVEEHREIWQVLERLAPQMAGFRVLVSGRAPVGELRLAGREAAGCHLTGLPPEEAADWLREAGVKDPDVLDRVVALTGGVPLALRLAVRLRESGGDVQELPHTLRAALVEGFLYQRVLDRVLDPLLKPVARDALVLRRLTADMVPEILGDSAPEGMDAAEVFRRLARELALVGDAAETLAVPVALPGTETLRLRPELRTAVLELLEMQDRERVRTIDERAARWYAAQGADDDVVVAELVYHRLRLQDVEGADQAWRTQCARHLGDAHGELAEPARAWLEQRLAASPSTGDLELWEQDALGRVHDLLGRDRSPDAVLDERTERSSGSPLVVFDAWRLWRTGAREAARALLQRAGRAPGAVGHTRMVLMAWFAAEAGDVVEADERLIWLSSAADWGGPNGSDLGLLLAWGAQVRLTVDVPTELAYLRYLTSAGASEKGVRVELPAVDVVVPALAEVLVARSGLHTRALTLELPHDERSSKLDWEHRVRRVRFANQLDDIRGADALRVAEPRVLPLAQDLPAAALDGHEPVDPETLEWRLRVLGWRRWLLVAWDPALARICAAALSPQVPPTERLALAGTIAMFSDERGHTLRLAYRRQLLGAVVDKALERVSGFGPPPTEWQAEMARMLMTTASTKARDELERWLGQSHWEADMRELDAWTRRLAPELRPQLLHILSPDPLSVLVRQVLGLPDHVQL